MKDKIASNRLRSLDALRGLDMLLIMGGSAFLASLAILFPTPFFQAIAEQTRHESWNGLHMEDCIFPLFLFIAGISFPFSLEKQRASGSSSVRIHTKVVTRGLVLVVLGFLYNGLLQLDFANMRWASVLGRIGLAWMFAALIFMHTRTVGRVLWCVVILTGYWLIMRYWPVDRASGIGWFDPEGTLARQIDMAFLPGQLACGGGTYDPEGILSTLPAIVTALFGMLTGNYVKMEGSLASGYRKTLVMIAAAIVLIAIGWLWSQVFPINKRMWTSSFVCVVGGISLLLFAVFYYVIDIKGIRRWTFFFVVIGMNSITIYLAQKFISFWGTANAVFGGVINLCPENARNVCGNIAYIAVCWLFLYFLYRKKIFLKV